MRAGQAEAGIAYRNALAAQIEHDPENARRWWGAFSVLLARALLVSALVGIADVFDVARRSGSTIDFGDADDPERVVPSMQFSKVSFQLPVEVELDQIFNLEGGIEFVGGVFQEALQEFESRIPRLRTHVEALALQSRNLALQITAAESEDAIPALLQQSDAVNAAIQNSFWVSDVTAPVIVNLQTLLAEAIRGQDLGGVTLPDFIDLAQMQGAHNLTQARLETIWRTNLSTAFNRAQAETLKSEPVQVTVPLVMINENRDHRTRGNPAGLYPNSGFHFQMDGYVSTMDRIEQQGLVPPNGYNCRGTLQPVSFGEALRRGWVDQQGNINWAALQAHNGQRQAIIDAGQYPDPGFEKITRVA